MNFGFVGISNYHFEKISISMFDIITIVFGLLITFVLWRLSKQKKSVQLRGYVPTIWTSLGIFFTFLSIYLSLLGYTENDNGFNIKGLIENIIPAFSTSIIGILGAIVTTICNRLSIANMEKEEDEKFAVVKRRYFGDSDTDSPELVLLEMVRSLQTGTKQICSKIGDEVTSNGKGFYNVVNRLNEILSKMSSDNTKIVETIQKSQENQNIAFGKAVDSLSKTFNGTIDDTKQLFGHELNSIYTLLSGKIQEMVDSNKKILEDTVKLQGEKLDFVKEKLVEESKKRNEQLEHFIEDENSRMQDFVNIQGEAYTELYERINQQISSHIENETTLFKMDIRQAIEDFAKTQYTTCVSTIEQYLSTLVEKSDDALQRQYNVTESFIGDLGNGLTMTCESLISRINTLSKNMSDKLDLLHNKEKDLIETTIDDNRGKIDLLLNTCKTEIERIVGEIKTESEKSIQKMAEFQDDWKEGLLKLSNDLNAAIVGIAEDSNGKIGSINESIQNTSKSLNEAMVAIKTDIELLIKSFKDQLEVQQGNCINANSKLSDEIAKQIHDSFSISELEDSCSSLISGINSCMADLQEKMSNVTTNLKIVSSSVEKSSKMYGDAVEQSNVINEYIQSTVNLIKLHKDVIVKVESSLSKVEKSVEHLVEHLSDMSKTKANTKK